MLPLYIYCSICCNSSGRNLQRNHMSRSPSVTRKSVIPYDNPLQIFTASSTLQRRFASERCRRHSRIPLQRVQTGTWNLARFRTPRQLHLSYKFGSLRCSQISVYAGTKLVSGHPLCVSPTSMKQNGHDVDSPLFNADQSVWPEPLKHGATR